MTFGGTMDTKNDFRFCWCGRPHPEGGHDLACKHHLGKEAPNKRDKQRKFSGDSAHREETGQFQAKVK